MAPKKSKKGKNDDDNDAHWEKLAAAKVASKSGSTTARIESDDEQIESTRAPAPSFAALDVQVADDDDNGDDLMAMISKNASNSKKKGKKEKKVASRQDDEEEAMDHATSPPEVTGEVDPDDWMNAEFGEAKEKKPKAGKKGKKGAKVKVESDGDYEERVEQVTKAVERVTIATPVVAAEEGVEDENNAEEGASKMLSKSEKEKIKKDKEKAKKKAQAAAKKQNAVNAPIDDADSTPAPIDAPESTIAPSTAVVEEEGEDGEEEEGGASKNKKKKKKKPAEKKVEAPKKPSGQISALRALVEAQKAAAEESERLIREHRERIEAEERKIEEEEARVAEEKARRKEKEKAKRDQMKKEGKLLTPKQKAEKIAAEIRMKALVGASGNTIIGLQQSAAGATGDDQPKKVSYAKKKPFKKVVEPKVEAVVAVVESPVIDATAEASDHEEEADIKDDWDASDEEAKSVEAPESVKDDWDASESEEEAKVALPTVAAAPVVKSPPNGASKAAAKSSKAPARTASPSTAPAKPTKAPPAIVKSVPAKPSAPAPVKPLAKGAKVAAPAESESEEESDDESGSDDESDSDDSGSDDSDEDSSSEEEEELTHAQQLLLQKKAEAKERRMKKNEEALAARSKDNMRSPICVILGHVDTGKTKLLDKIRQTNVQEGEAGGITQQIGATYFPMDTIRSKTAVLGAADLKEYRLPGLLVIDTPGHESFTNLRTRGSSLCNIAILVVDIMHGLEPQTLESLRLLREGKIPFIVALNKIDRLYGWKMIKDGGFQDSLAAQAESVQREYKDRLSKTILAFSEQGLNSLPYYENKDFGRIVSLVPTSAHTGEGVPDMLMLIVKLTQEKMGERLMYLSTLEATVLEVKVIEGLGTTIDVVLSNGVLHEGDRIVVCGLNGAIVTTIRALLTPQPLKELRIKGSYVHHKEVKASLGIKIVAPDLEKAIAGSRLLVLGEDDDEDELREDIMSDLTDLMNSVDKSGKGVCVQASTLGSLEALLEFLRTSKIPVNGINIGPVHRKHVMRAASMLEKSKELAVILCFDVPVDAEAEKLADELGIKIFKADIIYHLFDAFTAYNAAILEQKRIDAAPKAVWPCKLKIIAVFAKSDPIILGVDIIEGTLRVGTPLCIVRHPEGGKKTIVSLGKVTSLEINHKVLDVVKKSQAGAGVAVKIESASYENDKSYGRQFDDTDEVISMISRTSIDTLVAHFKADISKEDAQLIRKLKVKLDIP